jgi:uncharacterized repeat protein (TIGR01451 family)
MKQVNKNYSKILFVLLLSGLFGIKLINPSFVKADSYSSDEQKTISIDKKLRSVHDSKYVDNISSSTKTFSQGELIEFYVKVTNTGDVNLKNIKVTDNLPPFLKLIFYPGKYNSVDNKIEWDIYELNPGHSQKFLIRAKIDQASLVNTLTKETNVAKLWVDGIEARDDATYYILSKGKTEVVPDGKGEIIIPVTGSGDLIFQTIGVISMGLTGLAMRKKIRGY